ncbi:hypothetical protein GmHk_09G024346 [Glycine max]|nr:hypothetical protein GmHk_09G024346 [Glycine max]
MEYFVDDKRHDVNFQVGDWVFVKLRPCRQASVTRASYSKLTKRFFGPFQILRKYHLEDKVLFEEHDNVREGTKQPSPEAQKTESQLANTNQRPKRLVTKPQYLKDFI